jgi:hypothetical protein
VEESNARNKPLSRKAMAGGGNILTGLWFLILSAPSQSRTRIRHRCPPAERSASCAVRPECRILRRDQVTAGSLRKHASPAKSRCMEDSISMLVRFIHQILHFDLLPAGLIASMPHASCILLTKGGWHISVTATPRRSDFVSEARRQGEECQDEEKEAGQADHEK